MPNTNPDDKRPPGRPKMAEGYARDKVISIRVTDGGFRRVETLAKATNRTVAEYVREILKAVADGTILLKLPPKA